MVKLWQHFKGKTYRDLKKTFNSIGILVESLYTNNTIQINPSYQKFKVILTTRRIIINRWLSAGPVLLCQVISRCISVWSLPVTGLKKIPISQGLVTVLHICRVTPTRQSPETLS